MLSKPHIERRPRTMADQVYDILCRSIVAGELRSGERLVFEQLAPRLGVSQTPVREAVIRLVKDRLAIEGPDGKLQVVPLTETYVLETFMVRGVLEGLAAELATPLLSDAEIAQLRALLDEGDRGLADGNVEIYSRTSGPLHRKIIDVAANLALSHELDALRTHVDYILSYSKRQMGEHLLRSQEEHWQIVDSLAGRDPLHARQIVERHVRNSGIRIAKLIEYDRSEGRDPTQMLKSRT